MIQQETIRSLFVEMTFQDTVLSKGTAFILDTKDGPHLITNRHNVTGRHQETGAPLSATCGIPDAIVITHNSIKGIGQYIKKKEPLYNGEEPLWIEHPTLKGRADFVALRLLDLHDVALHPYPIHPHPSEVNVSPADVVSVIGFPFGIKAGGQMAVWSSGFIASEPEMDYDDLPVVLIDCRSRQGQSGSPVILYRSGGAIALKNGSTGISAGSFSELIGIYSGRIHKDSDLGMVWKMRAIRQLVSSINARSKLISTKFGSFSASGVIGEGGSINWKLPRP